MKRSLTELARTKFDVLIIGGGIYGACAAWDAALRGLSVAVVDQGDFGSATSSNSLKIIHGGLRYLQHADFKRMRESIRERRVMMQIAPHLVHPLACLMPTYGHGTKGKEVMRVALVLNDLVGFDRNRLRDPQKRLPAGRIISKEECCRLIPGVEEEGLTGGATWYDCQVHNSERLLFAFLHGAVQHGAQAANYIKATGFLQKGNRVFGIKAEDVLTGDRFDIQAELVINNSGPWVNTVLGLLDGRHTGKRVRLSKAMNLVLKRQLIPDYAVGVPSKFEFVDQDSVINKGSRLLFITPWRSLSLVGTTHIAYEGDPQDFRITEQDIQSFLDEVSAAYPAAGLTRDDVCYAYGGLLPMDNVNARSGDVTLIKHYMIFDHRERDGLDGFMTVVGVKYTTARDVAEKSIDLALAKLGKPARPSSGRITPVYGGDIGRFDEYLAVETATAAAGLPASIIRHLVYNYGTAYRELLPYIDEDSQAAELVASDSEVINAEVIYAVREEMAQSLIDVVRRRTELGSAGYPGDEAVRCCCKLIADELGWDEQRVASEVCEVQKYYGH